MKVKELIKKLKKFNGDTEITMRDYEICDNVIGGTVFGAEPVIRDDDLMPGQLIICPNR